MIYPIIMAGGSGTRLWPTSRSTHPKQFLTLIGEATMLQNTVSRLADIESELPTVICNEENRFFVAEQLRAIKKLGPIILEPVGRNTAPAIALAALNAKPDDILLVLAADHVISDQDAFSDAVKAAIPSAESGHLVTFGIVPSEAHTGYGYIHRGAASGAGFVVDSFVEKPSSEVAQSYLDSGEYYWNSGMFMFKAGRYLEELEKHRSDILSACKLAMADTQADLDFMRVDADAFKACPDESIDYAVMEKTDKALVVPMDAGWNDIGSWKSLWEISEKDADGNALVGDVITEDTRNSYVRAGERMIATLGIDDLVIVDSKDALLVAHKDRVQDVKKIVQRLKDDERTEFEWHREVYRPWGKYDSIDNGERYQVKRITVKPGAKLSVQMHHHRAEHWVVVSGTAKVYKGDEEILLTENESVYLPLGIVHALENPGKVPLELIEVQSGSYLGEDDIVRFEDRYGRAN